MRIVSVDTFAVAPRWLFLRVRTDVGVTGWGEATLEGHCEVVAAAVAQMAEYLVGQDPSHIERHWQMLYRGGFYRGGPVLMSALAGVDQALWDVAGKALGVPVHVLLGGAVRDRIRVYSWIGGDDPADAAEQASERLEAGFTAVKMNASGAQRPLESAAEMRRVVARVERVREVLTEDNDIALDFHGRMTLGQARRLLPVLEPLQPLFIEEPVVPECSHLLSQVTSATTIPVAVGERLYSRWDVAPILRQGVAVIQPDLSHAGGISEVRRIATLAETFDVSLAPHCPLGPIALAASLNVGAVSQNLLIQEQGLGIHYNEGSDLLDYLVDPSVFDYRDGFVAVPDRPGLGVEVDEAAVVAASTTATPWRTPTWRRDDGTLAEW